jgi:PleD family two-component response regulator
MSRPKRIAIHADDAASSRNLIKRLLVIIDYEVIEPESEEELIRVARELLPDVIILHERALFDPLNACQKLKSSDLTRTIPIILLTTNPEILQDKGLSVSFTPLRPPIDIDEFQALLENPGNLP